MSHTPVEPKFKVGDAVYRTDAKNNPDRVWVVVGVSPEKTHYQVATKTQLGGKVINRVVRENQLDFYSLTVKG